MGCRPAQQALVGAALALLSAVVCEPAQAERIKDLERSTARWREGRDHLLHGKPAQTLKLFGVAPDALRDPKKTITVALKKATGAERALCARALARVGRIAAARRALRGCKTLSCALAAARIERLAGDRKARLKVLGKAAKRFKDATLQVELGEALRAVGQRFAARRLLDPLADRYQEGQLKEIKDLVAVGRSLALNGYFKDANTVIAEASEGATDERERMLVELQWGLLFLSKYNFRDADVSLERVLKIDPWHPEATIAMARIDLDSDNDVRKARKRLDALLKRQPSHPGVLAMRAEVALRDEDMAAARRFVDAALRIRKDHREALHVLAATALRMDDKTAFKRAEKIALKHDPGDGELYVKAAHYLELGHRYPEVLKLLQKALKKNPELWLAHAQLGMSYARIADDKRAAKHLSIAFNNDPFNVRTANVLNILYDGVLKHMQLMKGQHVDLRVHRRSRKALERTMLPFLQDSYEVLAKKYKMGAKKPLQVEIFPTTEQFSVRTVGLPRLGAHAVCFGHLITSRSPHEAPFNWKMVLHHEMSHVFHIQASGGRVPRWLTEGVAMMESAWLDPTWHIIAERRAWDRLQGGQLAKIETFNLAFSQASSMQGIIDAYYQAMLLARFLEQKWGFDKLRRLIAAHGAPGARTPKLIRRIYGQTPAQLDAAFANWLGEHLDRFERDFRPDPKTLRKRLASEWRGDGRHREGLRKALDAMKKGHMERAYQALLLATYGRQQGKGKLTVAPPATRYQTPLLLTTEEGCAAAYLLFDLALAKGDRAASKHLAEQLRKGRGGHCDGVVQRLVLARDATREEQHEQASKHFEAAHKLDPRDGSVLRMWLQSTRRKDKARRIELSRKVLDLMPNDVLAPLALATESWRALHLALGMPTPAVGRGSREAVAPAKRSASAALKRVTRTVTPKPAAAAGRAVAAQRRQTVDLSGAQKARLIKDLKRAAQRLEEVIPTRRASVLFEARVAVAEGRLKWSMPIYREAARRSEGAKERAEAWCELQVVARKAKAKADADEAQRRCEAARAD